jgi:ferritin-like metal-binding protein YciE
MTTDTLDEQLTKYLTDAHSIERQALAQMKAAPKIAGDQRIAAIFETHEKETEEHQRLVEERLEARDAKPSFVKDAVGAVTGLGFGLFAASQPDSPGKLIVHALSYEHMEEAAYDLLAQVAERAGDETTAATARRIEAQEREMAERVAACFDAAAEASLRDHPRDDLQTLLDKYLADAHAIEAQSLELLDKGADIAGSSALAQAMSEHRVQTQEHQRLVEARLHARGASPSKLKEAALRLGALNWGGFFGAQPDTPAKLAGFAYAVEYLEVGAYEMLRRVAERAGDRETASVAERILAQEHEAAGRVRSLFSTALDVTLGERLGSEAAR